MGPGDSPVGWTLSTKGAVPWPAVLTGLCFSEVRLLEIVESLCGPSDFECNQMLEEHEERLEAWWLQL